MYEDNGNKCGKCQNHDFEVLKKGHAKDCPFKRCGCLKCRLLDARSDILQVISGKETKLKGTKKDPNCGFCQNHGIKILRKGHVRSCGFGQERNFKLENCFDCEVHYIRNEVNRLQIKMRRAMKEDRTLSEEQRKTAREAITCDEVERVCEMARSARKKREQVLAQQVGESSGLSNGDDNSNHSAARAHQHQLVDQFVRQPGVWRPWSQHQVAVAMAVDQHQLHLQQQQQLEEQQQQRQRQQQQQQLQSQHQAQQRHQRHIHSSVATGNNSHHQSTQQQQQLLLQHDHRQHPQNHNGHRQGQQHQPLMQQRTLYQHRHNTSQHLQDHSQHHQGHLQRNNHMPPVNTNEAHLQLGTPMPVTMEEQPLPLIHLPEHSLFNTLVRIFAARILQQEPGRTTSDSN